MDNQDYPIHKVFYEELKRVCINLLHDYNRDVPNCHMLSNSIPYTESLLRGSAKCSMIPTWCIKLSYILYYFDGLKRASLKVLHDYNAVNNYHIIC